MSQPTTEPLQGQEPLDQLQATLFCLINLYSEEPCCCTAQRVSVQMEKILRHELIFLFPELQKQYARFLRQWQLRAADAKSVTIN